MAAAPPRALIVGLEGPDLSARERAYLEAVNPWGVIVFARNVATPHRLSGLTRAVRAALGRTDAPVLVDQEGGRVQRLRPPHWPEYPPAQTFAKLYARNRGEAVEAAALGARLIASDLRQVGISVACLPVLDVPLAKADPIIGDRAYGTDPQTVAALGRAAAEGCLSGGCLPVAKHVPGHGRALCDSHLALPRVDAPLDSLRMCDFAPFRALRDLPLAMTAHVVYTAIDPDRPATVSPSIIGKVIRGEIGFDGLLMSDDLSMAALHGTIAERAEAALAAGCDVVLHCNGDAGEMAELAQAVPAMSDRALERAAAALDRVAPDLDREPAGEDVRARFAGLIGGAAAV